MQLEVAICEDDAMMREDTRNRVLELRPDFIVDTYETGEQLFLADKKYDMVSEFIG